MTIPAADHRPVPLRGRLVHLLTFIAFVDTFTLLPTIGPYAVALGATGFGTGLALGAYSITDLAFNVVGGVLLDRRGRRRLVLVGFAVAAGAVLLYPVVDSVGALVAVRIVHGVGGGILIPAIYTLIGDTSGAGGHGRAMGRVGATIGAAAVVAPGIAGAVRADAGYDAVFVGLAVVMAVGFAVAWLTVGETLDTSSRSQARTPEHSVQALLRNADLQTACIAAFGFTVGFGSLGAFLSAHLERLGHGPERSGGLFTVLALVAAVLMLTRVARRVDDGGPRRPVLLGLPAIVGALLLIGASDHLAAISAGMVLFGVGFGVVYPAASGATAAAAAAPGRGRAFGIFSVCYSSGFILGPPLAGYVEDQLGLSPFHSAAVLAAAALVTVLVRRTPPRPAHGQVRPHPAGRS